MQVSWMNASLVTILGFSTVLVAAPSASAQLIAQDSYTVGTTTGYTAGVALFTLPSTVASTGFVNGNYSGGSGTSNFVADSGGLTNASEGVNGSDPNAGKVKWLGAANDTNVRSNARSLANSTVPYSSTIYVGELFNESPLSGTGYNYVLSGFGNANRPDPGALSTTDSLTGGNNNISGLWMGYAGNNGSLVIDYKDSTAGVVQQAVLLNGATTSVAGTTFSIVAKVSIPSTPGSNTDTVTWWVNPTNFTSDSTLSATSLATGSFTGNIYTVSSDGTAITDIARLNYDAYDWSTTAYFDEATIGTTLANTFPNANFSGAASAPEPGSAALLCIGSMTFAGTLLRRRRS